MGHPDDETTPASHPLFNPPQAETDVGTLREGTNWLWDLTGRIVGRSGDMRSVVTGAAMEFSDLVTQDISVSGEYNDALWRKTCMDIAFAAGVGDQWADDVIDYKNDRAQLVSQFQTAIDSGPSDIDNSTAGTAESMRRANLVRQFQIRAENRLDELNDTGRERKRMLKDGPEPAHVAKLVDSGALGWAAYNLRGPGENPPLPVTKEQADGMAADLRPYLRGDKEPDARYFEIVSTLAAITNKAIDLQGRDRTDLTRQQRLRYHNLRSGEIEFLRSFYAGLEDQHTRGILYLPEDLAPQTNNGQGLEHDTSDPVREETWAALANGLLILSDPELGGSYGYLPPSIQRFADGEPYPNNAPGATHSSEENARAWMREAEDFERLLGRARPELQGGTDFSANVTSSIGHHLNAIDQQENKWDNSLSSLLDVTTRNEAANHNILTNEHDNPTFDKNSNALKGLYTHEWEDDGAAAAGLTDWIPEAAGSEDGERRTMAREAAFELIKTTAGEGGLRDELIDTGITVESNGREVTDAAFGLVNPDIAQSFGDVAIAYLEDFSDPDSSAEPRINPETGKMEMSYSDRQDFLEYAMSNDHAASDLYTAANTLDMAGVQAVASGDAGHTDTAHRSATLRGLLDTAVTAESMDRTNDDFDKQEADQATKDRWLGIVRTAGYAATTYAAGPAAPGVTAARAWLIGSTKIGGSFFGTGIAFQEYDARVNQQEISPNYQSPVNISQESDGPNTNPYAPNKYGKTYDSASMTYKAQLDTLDVLVQNGEVEASSIKEVAPELINEDGKVITYYEFKDDEHADKIKVTSKHLDDLRLNHDDKRGDLDTVHDGLEKIDLYTNKYGSKYNDIWDDIYNKANREDQEQADQNQD